MILNTGIENYFPKKSCKKELSLKYEYSLGFFLFSFKADFGRSKILKLQLSGVTVSSLSSLYLWL